MTHLVARRRCAVASDRAPAARYEVRHAGGLTVVTVDQRHHGNTWFPLGEFPFAAGSDPDRGSVTLVADESVGGSYVIADAVRFGGGPGIIDRGGGASGRPLWEEAARYFAQILGAPTSVYDTSSGDNSDDVTTRSRWAAWENEAGWDDSVFISWHSNAYNGSARGTSTYVYGPNDPGTGWQPAAQAGSEALATLVHNSVVGALRAGWDPAWPVSGIGLYSAWFGELNPSYNNEMPACLIELAFHDNTTDSNALRDPRFRRIATRAAVHAVIQYFADRDGYTAIYPPDEPYGVRVQTVGPGRALLSWEAPLASPRSLHGDPATAYLVQRSSDGTAFDDGVRVDGATMFVLNDLPPEEVTYLRVVALNDGGRSFPSPVVAVRPKNSAAQVLVVDGFTRLDRNQLVMENLAGFGLGVVARMFIERMNTYDYVIAHAAALAALDFSFDTTQKAGLPALDLTAYDAVVWFAGEQSTADETFTAAEQAQVCGYLEEGGMLFLSGSEYGWDLYKKGTNADQSFFTNCLGLIYDGDDAGTYLAATAAGGETVFDGSLVFDDGTFVYNVDYPDLIGVAGNGLLFLGYEDGSGGGAGVVTVSPHRVAALGFPFETIRDADTRTALLGGIFDWYGITPREEVPDADEVGDAGVNDKDEVVGSDEVGDAAADDELLTDDDHPDLSGGNDDITADDIIPDEPTLDEDTTGNESEVFDDHAAPVDDGIAGPDYGGGCEGGYYSDGDTPFDASPIADEQSDTDSAAGSHGGCGCSVIGG